MLNLSMRETALTLIEENHDDVIIFHLEDMNEADYLYALASDFKTASEELNDELLRMSFGTLSHEMPNWARLALAFRLLTVNLDPDTPSTRTMSSRAKREALDFAGEIGPEWAQSLYHFITLVTKLA